MLDRINRLKYLTDESVNFLLDEPAYAAYQEQTDSKSQDRNTGSFQHVVHSARRFADETRERAAIKR